jgi:hypothetical protein
MLATDECELLYICIDFQFLGAFMAMVCELHKAGPLNNECTFFSPQCSLGLHVIVFTGSRTVAET